MPEPPHPPTCRYEGRDGGEVGPKLGKQYDCMVSHAINLSRCPIAIPRETSSVRFMSWDRRACMGPRHSGGPSWRPIVTCASSSRRTRAGPRQPQSSSTGTACCVQMQGTPRPSSSVLQVTCPSGQHGLISVIWELLLLFICSREKRAVRNI